MYSVVHALSAHAKTADPSADDLKEVIVIGASLYRDQINTLKSPPPILDFKASSSSTVLRLRAGVIAAFQTASTILVG